MTASDTSLESGVDEKAQEKGLEKQLESGESQKVPPPILQDAEGIQDEEQGNGLTRHQTQIAHLMNLDEGLVGWDSQEDSENPQ